MENDELLLIEELLALHRERLDMLAQSKKSQTRNVTKIMTIDEKIRNVNKKLKKLYGY